MTACEFPRARRLTQTRDFDRVYALKQRAGDAHLLVFAAPNAGQSTRIGLSVSRKHGNSVVRHRLKRLLREAYRLVQHDLPEGVDLVLIPRVGIASSVDDYRTSLLRIVPRLVRRLSNREGKAPAELSNREGEAPAEPSRLVSPSLPAALHERPPPKTPLQ